MFTIIMLTRLGLGFGLLTKHDIIHAALLKLIQGRLVRKRKAWVMLSGEAHPGLQVSDFPYPKADSELGSSEGARTWI